MLGQLSLNSMKESIYYQHGPIKFYQYTFTCNDLGYDTSKCCAHLIPLYSNNKEYYGATTFKPARLIVVCCNHVHETMNRLEELYSSFDTIKVMKDRNKNRILDSILD